MALLSPVLAIVLTLIAGGIIFALRGLDPLHALYVYFVEPLTIALVPRSSSSSRRRRWC